MLAILLIGALASPLAEAPGEATLGKGAFLVSKQTLTDPNFESTVILLLEYGEDGAQGLVVNRPSQLELASLFPEVEALRGRKLTLYYGGPVRPGRVTFLLSSPEPVGDGLHIVDDVLMTGKVATIEALLEQPDGKGRVRAYAGHAGWAPGQLDAEVASGYWYVALARTRDVFEPTPDRLWRRLIDRLSGLRAFRADALPECG